MNVPTKDAPEAPVESPSIDDKLAAKFGLNDDEPAPQAEPEPESRPDEGDDQPVNDSEELSSEEVQDEEAQRQEDEWELIHNGQKKRLKREEALKLAQQGFDYTQKTQALADQARAIEQQKQALAARVQLTDQFIKAGAVVEAIQSQLQHYQNVDWVALAQSDPNGYPQHHAQFQRLQAALQRAQGQYQQVGQQVNRVDEAISELDMQASMRRLLEKVPAWTDNEKASKDKARMYADLQERGFEKTKLDRYLWDPDFIALARDAMLYREAVKNRSTAKKVPQAPAVRPGAAPARVTPTQEKQNVVKQLHQAKDPARKRALLDEALALKFNLR